MKYLVKGHAHPDVDSVISGYLLTKILNKLGIEAEYIIPETIDDETLGICRAVGFEPQIFQVDEYDHAAKFILVDHYEDEGLDVVGIVDHHASDLDKSDTYWYEPASSASIMLAIKYEELLDAFDIMLASLASFVDTVSFHSTKSRESDHEWIKEASKKYNLDYDYMYEVGLCLTDISDLEQAQFNGIKKYIVNDKKLEAAYVQVKEISEDKLNYILDSLKKYVVLNDLEVFAFIVYDLTSFNTIVYKVSKDDIEVVKYDYYAARGDVVVKDIRQSLSLKAH